MNDAIAETIKAVLNTLEVIIRGKKIDEGILLKKSEVSLRNIELKYHFTTNFCRKFLIILAPGMPWWMQVQF